MEWVETTAKSLDDAKNAALDQLGVAADEAEFDIVEEPKPGLFGRTRGEARVRARVKPTQVRPKNERRRRNSKKSSEATASPSAEPPSPSSAPSDDASTEQPAPSSGGGTSDGSGTSTRGRSRTKTARNDNKQERKVNESNESTVTPQEVGDAAVAFMEGLVDAFGESAEVRLQLDGTELDVSASGENLGLMVGPGGRTLNAIQDLARVSSQRRLGDHETRLRIDVAGYRERRSEALTRFAADVAGQVRESGVARSLEPMSSADRKVIHDALNDEDGVSSRSEGDDPNRRVVVVPA